jgi:hypothetical protein
VEHDKLKERRGGWGCESGIVASSKILGSVGEKACMVAEGIGIPISCMLPDSVVVVVEQH